MNNKDKELSDYIYRVKDFLEGDTKSTMILSFLSDPNRRRKIKRALDFLLSNPNIPDKMKRVYLQNSWMFQYKRKPPTPDEFLSEKYLGPMGKEIFPKSRKIFVEFLDPTKDYRTLILYPHIGFGKSTLAALITVYIALMISLMWDPKKFFNQVPSSVLSQVLVSYTQKKASQILLSPIINILESSPYFYHCKTREQMLKKEREFQEDREKAEYMCWTRASFNNSFDLQFSNGSFLKICSRPSDYLGLTIVSGTLTELSFFKEAGKSDEFILRVFRDLIIRIESRMKGNYFGRAILDTSPNDMESPIDRYIVEEAPKDPRNYIVSGSRWKFNPEEFTMDDVFHVFIGGNGMPPRILSEEEASQFDPNTVIKVPKSYSHSPGKKDIYYIFESDLVKALKDMAGVPSGSLDKVFYYKKEVEDIFVPGMRNVYAHISAPDYLPPQGLIWNQVKNIFFNHDLKTLFYISPTAPRYLHIDQSVSKDSTGIACVHREIDSQGRDIYVVDFTLVIVPERNSINLEAIPQFILDLIRLGNLPVKKVSFDQYQSETAIQMLSRAGIDVTNLSVDRTPEPYLEFISLIRSKQVKVGRNIYLKNNLLSLRYTKRPKTGALKIDHTLGDLAPPSSDQSWETSILGRNSKDIADAVCGAIALARTDPDTIHTIPKELWSEEKFSRSEDKKKEYIDLVLKQFSISPAQKAES